jgi:hypothetical protein
MLSKEVTGYSGKSTSILKTPQKNIFQLMNSLIISWLVLKGMSIFIGRDK